MVQYLNNAGAGMMSDDTFQIISNYYRHEQAVGAYQAARDKKDEVSAFYENAARLINADDLSDIAFVDSASRGWNLAIYGASLKKGDSIFTLSTEFGTNLITIYDYAKRVGANVHVIECAEDGSFEVSVLEELLKVTTGAKIIAISHAAAQGSIVNPINEVGLLAKRYNALYIVDGCQSAGQMAVDVKQMNCDVFVTTGRKWLCGPRGTGFMYVKKSANIRATQLDLASADLVLDDTRNVLNVKIRVDARKFELWEKNIAALLGLSRAIDTINNVGIDIISKTTSASANVIRSAVAKNENLRLLGERNSLSGIVGFYLLDPSFERYVTSLFSNRNLSISTMSDWDCPLAFPRNGANTIFRLSPHYFTDNEIIKSACEIINAI